MKVKIDIVGVEKTIQTLNNKLNKININTMDGIKKSGFLMQNAVKSSIAGHEAEPTSVDTGLFVGTVSLQTFGNEAMIFSPLEYAKFLEYGTTKLRPRKHFRNSAFRKTEQIKEILDAEIKVALS